MGRSCPDDWLAQFSLTNVNKGGPKQHVVPINSKHVSEIDVYGVLVVVYFSHIKDYQYNILPRIRYKSSLMDSIELFYHPIQT